MPSIFARCILLVLSCLFISPTFGQTSALKNPTLSVTTIDRKPFAFRMDGKTVGFSIDLWEMLAESLTLDYSLKHATTFSSMLEAVQFKKTDLAIANISISSERETHMDFSHPIFDAGLQIMVPTSGDSPGLLQAVLTWRMAGLVLTAIIGVFILGNLMWLFERNKQPYFQKSYREGLWPSFWWAMHAIISGGFEERVPRSIPGRILATALLISTLFLVSAFVATLTSALTVGELRSGITSISDLAGKDVGTTRGSTASRYLQSKNISHTSYDSMTALYRALENSELNAIVHDAPLLAYYANNDGRGKFRTVGAIFKAEKYAIAFPEGSELVERVNRALLKLRETGSYQAVHQKWFGAQ